MPTAVGPRPHCGGTPAGRSDLGFGFGLDLGVHRGLSLGCALWRGPALRRQAAIRRRAVLAVLLVVLGPGGLALGVVGGTDVVALGVEGVLAEMLAVLLGDLAALG